MRTFIEILSEANAGQDKHFRELADGLWDKILKSFSHIDRWRKGQFKQDKNTVIDYLYITTDEIPDLTPEEKEVAVRGLAARVAIDDLIKKYQDEYNDLVEQHIRIIKS